MLRISAVIAMVAVLSFGVSAADADGDGFSDALEAAFKTNPNDAASVPAISGAAVPFTRLALGVDLNFEKDSGRVRVGGRLALPPNTVFASNTIIFDIGGIVRSFATTAEGFAVVRDNAFTNIPGSESDGRFAAAFNISNLAELADNGIDSVESKGKVVTLPLTIYVGNLAYTSTLTGVYNVAPNKKGKSIGEARYFSETIDTSKPPTLPQVSTTLFEVTPNPAKPNEPVTFAATSSVKDTEGILGSLLLFGDGTAAVRQPGFIFANGATQEHTYRAERGYTARLLTIGRNGLQVSKLFIAVGDNTALNGFSGLGSTLQRTGATLQFAINTENVEKATKVLTSFTDTIARAPLTQTRSVDVESRETIEGELPSRSATTAGITVADTTVVDENGATQAQVRKQVAVSDADVGASDALPAPITTEITVTKMSGKFLFGKTTADQVTLKGEITLPTGFQPAKADGNSFVVGIGNVVDTVIVDSKGKPLDPKNGTNGRIKKLKITYPRLAKGTTATVGGEIAKINVTFSIPDLDVAGFDTEGITASVREDEADMPEVERYIQVGMVLEGVAFESTITVEYKVVTNSDTGTFQTRSAK